MALLSALEMEIAIPVCVVIGITVSLWQWHLGSRDNHSNEGQSSPQQAQYDKIKKAVSEGVESFLSMEYRYAVVFVATFASIIFLLLGSVERFSTQSRPCKFNPSNTCKPALVTAVFSTVSFILGALTSVVFGSLGTKIARNAKARTTSEERNTAGRTFRSGAVMGFLLAAIDLLVLYLVINLFKLYYGNDWEGLFEAITGYALGGSSMALFRRASGGIYAKAADVCVHLVEEIDPDCRQTDQNPAVITDYVGDIVGDIAGMGPDLFGSYAGSSCAALVLASISSFGIEHDFTAMCYPLIISSMGILVCLITTVWGEIKPASKKERFIISTILMTVGIFVVSLIVLPSSFTIYNIGLPKVVKNQQLSFCVGVGFWAGQISWFVNEYYASDDFSCLRRVYNNAKKIRSCLQSDAVNNSCPSDAVNSSCTGLQVALEHFSVAPGSVRIPFFAAVSIFVSYPIAATYGIAVAALGMLSTTATQFAIDASGPISNNAERIARMARSGARGAAGNTTAAIGKGFAIDSAALVSIALFSAFVNRPAMSSSVDVLTPKVIVGLITGTWLPYRFSAMTMKSVGRAGFKMALALKVPEEVPEEVSNSQSPEEVSKAESKYAPYFKILNEASFRGMIKPTALVTVTPLIIGTFFGVETLSGLLAGSLSSVVQIAISAPKTAGEWNQAKEDIKAGALEHAKAHCPDDETLLQKVKDGKTIGNPQKDTSGPPSTSSSSYWQSSRLCLLPSLLVTVVCSSIFSEGGIRRLLFCSSSSSNVVVNSICTLASISIPFARADKPL